jgi:predicted membrane protein
MIDIIGYLGMIFVLLTLYLTRKHYETSQVISIISGLLWTIYGLLANMLPIILLNLICIQISLYNLIKTRKDKNKKKKLSLDEAGWSYVD